MIAPEGKIDPDSPFAQTIGFTSDKFHGWLWNTGDRIYISLILSIQEGQGDFSRLLSAIESLGYEIAVPTPFPKMKAILEHKGFHETVECDPEMGEIEVWVKNKTTIASPPQQTTPVVQP